MSELSNTPKPKWVGLDRQWKSVLSAKSQLLSWADEHDARRKGPWPIIGAVAAGAAAVLLARTALPGRVVVAAGARAPSLVARIARPIMRMVVAGRMGYWFWTQTVGRRGRLTSFKGTTR